MLPEADVGADELRVAVEAWGGEAVSFQALEPGLERWRDDGPAGTGAIVAFAGVGKARVVAGSPLVASGQRRLAAERFVAHNRGEGKRTSFFGIEAPAAFAAMACLEVGAQPRFDPSRWVAGLARSRGLREQLRRARAKGVVARRVEPTELAEGTALRTEVDELAQQWLAARPMAPMGFLVSLEPFVAPDQHRYFVAERAGKLVAFLSLVPIPARHGARQGWLFEDLVRASEAPNGTSECLIDCAMRDLAAAGVRYATLGLAPLSAGSPWWARLIGWIGRPLYDFRGVRAFKERLHPLAWEPVYLAYEDGLALPSLLDSLRAFAGGSLVRFGWATLRRHPGSVPFALALPLVPWTALLAVLVASGSSGLLGFGPWALCAWVLFDAVLAAGLFRAARRPRAGLLGLLATAAAVDAAFSVVHLLEVGLGSGLGALLRMVATAAPVIATVALARCWLAYRSRERKAPRSPSLGAGSRPSTSQNSS